MRCLERFNQKMNISGGSLRDENVKNSKLLLHETFTDDASFTQGIYMWQLGKLGKEAYQYDNTINIRLYKRTFSAANGVVVKFQTEINNPVVVGDIIYDSVADEYLICTESFNLDGIHWQGKVTLCNWILKWQDKKGRILKYPCYDMNSTQYNSGEQSNRQFTIGSSQHMITLPCDENTVILSSPQRVFLDKNTISPTSYIVTQNDTTSYNYGKKGLVKVTVMEYPTNDTTDRIDLGICDYMTRETIKKNNADCSRVFKSVISYNTQVIKSGGDSQLFIGKFFDDNKKEITDITPKWEIICDFKDALIVKESGNQISIGINNDDYVDEEFKLILSDIDDNYPSTLLVKIESLL